MQTNWSLIALVFYRPNSAVDTGHISLYGAIQSLKLSPLPDEDFDTTTDHFNAV